MKRVVLFDFHNTLATCDGWLDLEIRTLPALVLQRVAEDGLCPRPTGELLVEAQRLFKELRQRVRDSGVELSAVQGTTDVLTQLGLALPERAILSAVEHLEYACLPEVAITPNAMLAVESLRNAGCRLGVVSSAGFPPFVELALEKLGLRAFFSEVVTSAGAGLYKSNPEIFKLAVARLGGTPDEAVHVGDHTRYDVHTAREAGLSAIWYAAHARNTARSHGQPWGEVASEGAEADAVITDLADLYQAIQTLATPSYCRETSGL